MSRRAHLATAKSSPTLAYETPLPPVAVPPANDGCYNQLLAQYDWDVRVAEAIMRAESGCDTNASHLNTNGSTDYGLMQDNSVHSDMVASLNDLYDPGTNIAVAYRIYSAGGWNAWSTYSSGAYQRYL